MQAKISMGRLEWIPMQLTDMSGGGQRLSIREACDLVSGAAATDDGSRTHARPCRAEWDPADGFAATLWRYARVSLQYPLPCAWHPLFDPA